jgi:hypothetical protein
LLRPDWFAAERSTLDEARRLTGSRERRPSDATALGWLGSPDEDLSEALAVVLDVSDLRSVHESLIAEAALPYGSSLQVAARGERARFLAGVTSPL